MSTTSTANSIFQPSRRSTRIDQAITVTVMGVDSYRGPYREEVATVSVSCHGCKYESKHDVLTNSWVMLEVADGKPGSKPVAARGFVKWVKRSPETGGPYQTAIELEEPGNIWGIDSPPRDWLQFSGPRSLEMDTSKPKPFTVPRPDAQPAAVAKEKQPMKAVVPAARETKPVRPATTAERPTAGVMVQFQKQMEAMLFEAANVAVREKAAAAVDEIREGLREDAKRILADAAASESGTWIEQAAAQMREAVQESTQSLHAQWVHTIEQDLQAATERIEERSRELDNTTQSLSAGAMERLQRGLESSRKEGVDRILLRLKEQVAPVLEDAKNAVNELGKRAEELEKAFEQSLEKSLGRSEEACIRYEKQFEMIIREHIDAAREELQRLSQSAAENASTRLSAFTRQNETEAKERFQKELEPIAEATLADLKEKAASASSTFADELGNYSRSHLEFVSNAISGLAKGIGDLAKGKE